MSLESEQERLLAPIEGDSPAGVDLEDTALLASFDSLRVFGNIRPPAEDAEPNWRAIRTQAIDALSKSKDLRVLAYWTAAVLHLEGWPGLSTGLQVAAGWLADTFDQVYPRPDGKDATLRKNSLGYFADRIAIVDALRRAPLVATRQGGPVTLRDLAIVSGELKAAEGETAPTSDSVAASFAAAPLEDLNAAQKAITDASTALKAIDDAMRAFGGSQASPALEAVAVLVTRAAAAVGEQVAAHAAATLEASAATASASDSGAPGAGGARTVSGPIRSREDAIRALDAVATFFRGNEPSSPVPLFIERAKRLVGKNFLEALEDIAPAALPQARDAGGIKDPNA